MTKDIAIIGINGRFPGAENIEAFRHILQNGINCITDIPESRKKQTCLKDKKYRKAAFLDEVDKFDHSFFGISKADADYMDPHHRILLEIVYGTFENAGYDVGAFSNSNTGVYVSCSQSSYFHHIEDSSETVVSGNLASMVSGRIARYFNLKGSAVLVDTACSSSLVALHIACNDILLNDVNQAIVCASSLNLFPLEVNSGVDIGIFSSTDKVSAFSETADGTIGGEACIGLLIKPLDTALADNDIIHAVIKATAVNQDANRSSFLTAPSKIAQEEVIITAWQKAGIDPQTIEYIEAHGTGTKIGDPIEFDGLTSAFKRFTGKKHFCGISSVKTNIGHTDVAAGLVGVVKVVLSLKNKKMYPSLNFSAPNLLIDFNDTALIINDKIRSWKKPQWGKRRAGVSSFGLSGTNCHVVLEEAPAINTKGNSVKENFLFAISSKTLDGLKKQLIDVAIHLEDNPKVAVDDVSYTLCVGRKHHRIRYSVCSDNIPGLIEKIKRDLDADATGVDTENISQPNVLVLLPQLNGKDKEQLDKLVDDFKPAAEAKNEFNELNLSIDQNKNLDINFIYQYCLFRILESCGLTFQNLAGYGAGDVLIDVITKKTSLTEAIGKLNSENNILKKGKSRFNDYVNSKLSEEGHYLILLCVGESDQLMMNINESSSQADGKFRGFVIFDGTRNSLINLLEGFYLLGEKINWKAVFNDKLGKRVELPIYNFNKTRCWFKEIEIEDRHKELEDLIYNIEWGEELLGSKQSDFDADKFLIFSFDQNLAENLCAIFGKRDIDCIKIIYGSEYHKINPCNYIIRCNEGSDYLRLRQDLLDTQQQIDGILHLGSNLDINREVTMQNVDCILNEYVFSYFYLVDTFNVFFKKGFKLSFVTQNSNVVMHHDKGNEFGDVANSFLKSIMSDFPTMAVNAIDIDSMNDAEMISKVIIDELFSESQVKFAAYRDEKRYVPFVSKEKAGSRIPLSLPSKGVYMITGGLNGLGFELAKSLVAQNKISELVILGRMNLTTVIEPGASVSEKERKQRIENINVLKNMGAEVHYYGADIGSFKEIANVFNEIKKKIYRLDGVFHLAGLPGHRTPLANLDIDRFVETLNPKITGTILLHHFTWSLHPKFFVCFSSLNAIVPLKNSLDYTIANAFQDAYAKYSNSQITRFYSVNWPGWDNVGMSRKSFYEQGNETLADEKLKLLNPKDGFEILMRILNQEKPQLLVGDIDWSGFKVNPYFNVRLNEKDEDNSPSIVDSKETPHSEEDLTKTENIIKSIWYDVLQEEGINLSSDFFDIGGNSLNGIQVINSISKQFGAEIEFEDIFDFPTLKELSAYVDSLASHENDTNQSPIPTVEEQQYYQVSSTQKRFWIMNQFDTDNEGYNLIWVSELIGNLNENALQMALNHLIHRYEILRTVYIRLNNELVQSIKEPENVKKDYKYFDLSNLPEKEDKAEELMKSEENKAFDLLAGPLVNAMLMKLGHKHFLFSITMPHICTDAWSTNIINNEIRACYDSCRKGEIDKSVPPKIQYKDYAAWHNRNFTKQKNEELKSYWNQKLEGEIPVLNFPTDFERPVVKNYEGSICKFEIKGDVFDGFLQLAKKNEVSHFMLLLSFVKLLIFRYTNQTDIVVGTPIAGRIHYDLEDQLGCFLNTLALRTKFDINASFQSQLKKVKTTVLEAFEHQAYPFDKLVRDLGIKRDAGRMPLFDVLIDYQHSNKIAIESVSVTDLEIKAYTPKRETSKFDLSFDFVESEDRIFVEIEYDTQLFLPESIELIQYRFLKIIDLIVKEDNRLFCDIGPLLTIEEKQEFEANQNFDLDEAF